MLRAMKEFKSLEHEFSKQIEPIFNCLILNEKQVRICQELTFRGKKRF